MILKAIKDMASRLAVWEQARISAKVFLQGCNNGKSSKMLVQMMRSQTPKMAVQFPFKFPSNRVGRERMKWMRKFQFSSPVPKKLKW